MYTVHSTLVQPSDESVLVLPPTPPTHNPKCKRNPLVIISVNDLLIGPPAKL